MPTIPEGARSPQDHKSPQDKDKPDGVFSFRHRGEIYRFAKPTTVELTPGFVRRNRNNPAEFQYGLIEALAGDDVLEVLDTMTMADNLTVMRQFDQHVQDTLRVSVGESASSST